MELRLTTGEIAVIDDAEANRVHEVGFSCGLIWRGTIASMTWRGKKRRHTTYAVCTLAGALELRLHRVILDATAPQVIDHRDGNGLNCMRANLRTTGFSGNSQNRGKSSGKSSTFKGVSLHKQTGKWSAQIKMNRTKTHLGLFATEQEAAAAYDAASKELFGEFARPNAI